MSHTVDLIREDQETIVDVHLFWRLVKLAMQRGLVDGFTPSPTVETDADRAFAAETAKMVTRAIEKGRRDAHV